jgi:ABC-type bacteriocin/lantibiotic exporter with double-glycine peptidase domain
LQESIDGMQEIRVLNKESFFHDKMLSHAKKYANASMSHTLISIFPRYLLELVIIIFVVLLVVIYTFLGNDSASLISTLGVFGVASIRLLPSANQIINGLVTIRHSRNSIHLLYSDLHSKDVPSSTLERCQIEGEFNQLELKGVGFSYPDSTNRTLSDISLKIGANESIGIVGASGSGKTTLIGIFLGMLKNDDGDIFINNNKVDLATSDWMSKIMYLPQQVFLINDTLKNNIALGQEEGEIDDDAVELAINNSNLDSFVSSLPDGINTILGERGARLSGGQKQRVAIARMFYFDRSIMIMDESTSALDQKMEGEIIKEINAMKGKITMIIIAHRLATLKHCDTIYRLENGRIVQHGSYKKVIGNERHY